MTTPFPQPVYMAGMRARWRLSDLERYEAGETDRTSEHEVYLSAVQVAERFRMSRVAVWKQARLARDESEQDESEAAA